MPPRTLILGLGNPVRSDDGVGIHVVDRLREAGPPEGVRLEAAGAAGLAMLDLVAGYERLVVVDAIDAGLEPGTVLELSMEDLERLTPLHAASSHEADLATTLELGRRLGLPMPAEVAIVAVQAADIVTFAEQCTPEVYAAIDEACALALRVASYAR